MAFSSRCGKKREATEAARQSRNIGVAGRAHTSAAWEFATGSNRVVFGPSPQSVANRGGDEEEMGDADDEEEEAAGKARDTTMAETETDTASWTATRTVTHSETLIGTGALAPNDQVHPAQQREVIKEEHRGAGDESRT